MTVTAPNCPVAESLPRDVKVAVETVSKLKSVWVELTFDPPWNPDRCLMKQNWNWVCFNT